MPGPAYYVRRLQQKAVHIGIRTALQGLSQFGKAHPESLRWREGVDVLRDVPYSDSKDSAHTLDIYRPCPQPGLHGGNQKLPVLLYLHGGGFTILSKDTHWMFGFGFAQRGFLVISINYRLAPKHRFPAALEDAADALAWVHENAADYGGDLDRLTYAGESAGGNLACALSIMSTWKRPEPYAQRVWNLGAHPKAVLPACGILEVSDPHRYDDSVEVPEWSKASISNVCKSYVPDARRDPGGVVLASPLRFFENAPPPDRDLPAFFAPCGTRDPIAEDTRRLGRALTKLGADVQTPFYDGGIHAFHAFIWEDLSKRCWADQDRFLTQFGLTA